MNEQQNIDAALDLVDTLLKAELKDWTAIGRALKHANGLLKDRTKRLRALISEMPQRKRMNGSDLEY